MGVQHSAIDHTGLTGVGGGGVTVQDEGTPLATAGTTLNFVGAGVAATGAGATKTITIAGAAAEFATGHAAIVTGETTTSTTYADLATVGPSVTVTIGASGKAKVSVRCRVANNTAAKYSAVGVVISGATTVAAATWLLNTWTSGQTVGDEFGATRIVTGLNAGSTTFKMQYLVESNTGTFTNRELIVEPVL